ncbi:MAG: hypothetical protein ACRCZJ_05350 [Erysipelotrichaceae bacterium]
MKKLQKSIVALLAVAMIAGCSDATTNLSNGKDSILTIGKETLTVEQIYDVVLQQGQISSIINLVTEKIIDIEVPITDEITEEATTSFNTLKEAVGDNFLNLVKQAGFESEEQYYEERVLYATRAQHLSNVYLETNFEQAIADYVPLKVNIIETTDEDDAKAALEAVQTGTSFEDAAEEYGTSTTFDGVTQVITNQMGIDSTVYATISKATAGIVEEVLENAAGSKFYIVQMVDAKAENFRDDAITAMATASAVSDTAFQYFLKKYDFKIYDIDLYNAFKSQAPKFIIQD